MGSHLFTARSGSNLGIRMRKKLTYLYSCRSQLAAHKPDETKYCTVLPDWQNQIYIVAPYWLATKTFAAGRAVMGRKRKSIK
jgi:hypothetical protein